MTNNQQPQQKKRTPVGWIVGGVVVLIVIIALVAVFVTRGGESNDQAEDTTQTPHTSESAEAEADSGENLPGAAVGNTQRTWPGFSEMDDDSAHAKPGTHSVSSVLQRPVWTPKNHDGDFPSRDSLVESMDACKDPEAIELTGKTQQQYVNARYLAVNSEAGPTKSVRGVPRGYAHSPQGAVMSAMNAFTYGQPGAGDEIGFEAENQLWSSSKDAMEVQDRRAKDFDNETARAELWEPPSGFRIKSCGDDVVVVEVVVGDRGLEDQVDSVVMRLPMVWKDGDWVPDMSGSAEKQMIQPSETVENFTKVRYQ